MPSYSKIGAQIGVEGYDKFHREITNIKNDLKGLQSEMKVITTSFTAESKSIQDVNKQRAKLSEQIAATSKKLETELNLIQKIKSARETEIPAQYAKKQKEILASGESEAEIKKQLIKAEADYNAAMQRSVDEQRRLETQSNNTQVALNNLNNEMNDLPADNFIGRIQVMKDALANNKSELKQWGDLLSDVGSFMTKSFTVPIVGGFAASVKSAVDWESALNGVRKTTDMDEESINALGDALRDQALTTIYSSTELANLAQIAGQLGVRGSEDILKFVNIVSDLGIATDLSAEDAATSLARIFNITEGGNLDNLEAIGSVIVHLGNNMATTEPEIVAMANRMASAGKSAGLATTDIFALSSALTSVGITAEAGGSTVGQVLKAIQKDVAQWTSTGEGNMTRLAEISGMTAEEFANTWQNKPVKAFEAFVTGLGNLKEDEENIVLILDELDMAGIRQSNMLQALALAQEEGTDTTQLFTEALRLTDEAYKGVNEGTQNFLDLEADVRKGESATQFSNLAESVQQLGQTVGEVLLPVIIPIVQGLTDFFKKLSEMDDGTKQFVITILGIVAALGPLLSLIGTGLTFISSLSIAAGALSITVGSLLTTILAGVGIITAVIAAIVAVVAVIKNWGIISDYLKEKWEGVKEWFDGFLTWISTGFESLITWLFLKIVTFGQDAKNAGVQIQANINQLLINIVNWVRDKLTEAGNFIRDKLNTIRTFFTDLAASAWNWGKNLIGNFIDGIKNKFGQLKDSVVGIANMIASHIHFSEPDVGALSDFHKWMPDMMHGLAKGIDDNLYLVDNAISRVADAMNLGNSVNYGGVVINLNVPSGTNGRQLVDEIETELANRTLRRKAVFE